MSTRGFLGFVADGREIIAYKHSDSYPDGLGVDVLTWAREADMSAAREAALNVRLVTEETPPTAEDIAKLAPWTNRSVGGRKETPDWYQLLRGTQGDPQAMLDAGVVEDASEFPCDSLFAEWGYLVDFDTQTFEVYRGFQHSQHGKGRFADRTGPTDDYVPVALLLSWPLTELPSDDEFYAAIDKAEQD